MCFAEFSINSLETHTHTPTWLLAVFTHFRKPKQLLTGQYDNSFLLWYSRCGITDRFLHSFSLNFAEIMGGGGGISPSR